MSARRLMLAVGTTALVASGVYVFVYLYRWEWHRATLAGVVFVAAEVGLGIFAILERLRRLEHRFTESGSADDLRTVVAHIEQAAPEERQPFQWLAGGGDRLSVFVPILLGAGVVLSAAAWAVERIAHATAGAALERSLALRLAPLGLPAGTLTGAPRAKVTLPSLRGRRLRAIAITVVAGISVAVGVDVLADLTQDRPDAPLPAGAVSVVTLQVDSKAHYNDGGVAAVAETIWGSCTSQLRRHQVPEMVHLGGGLVEAVVTPALGPQAQERLRGCLADGTVDRLKLEVHSVRTLNLRQ